MTRTNGHGYGLWVASLLFAFVASALGEAQTPVTRSSEEGVVDTGTGNPEMMRLFAICVEESGEAYREARDKLLEFGPGRLGPIVKLASEDTEDWLTRIVVGALKTRLERPREGEAFDAQMDVVLRTSRISRAPNKPKAVMFISGDIARVGRTTKMEALVLCHS